MREIREELAVEIELGDLAAIIDHDYADFHLRMHCFWAELAAGEQPELLEHDAARWVSAAELAALQWLPADLDFLPQLAAALHSI